MSLSFRLERDAHLVVLALVAQLVIGAQLHAQLTAEQALNRRGLADVQWQPGGGHIAFTVSEPTKGTVRERHVWLMDARAGTARQFTNSSKSEWSPRWSPDGRTLAFLSDRGDRTAIYRLTMDGGEAMPLLDVKTRPTDFVWSPDGRRIAFLAAEECGKDYDQRVRDKDDARVVDRDNMRTQLWVADIATKSVRELTHPPLQVSGVEWTPDGTRLLVVGTDHPEADAYTNRMLWVSATDGALTPFSTPRGPSGRPQLSRDGSRVAWVGARVDGPAQHDLKMLMTNAGSEAAPRNLTATTLDRPIRSFEWAADGSLIALVQDGFTHRLVRIAGTSAPATLFDAPVYPTSFDVSDSSVVAFVGERTAKAPELWIARHGGAPVQVTHVNDAWNAIRVVEPQIVHWKSFDGRQIEGALLLPNGAATHLPLIVDVHGGPAGAWGDAFESWGQMLVSRGYAVLYPNPRGSTGYGQAFLEANRGDWGGGDFKDIMAGVDDLIARGIADPDRLGIGGWSYGGYMSEWAITQTTRFKAAIAGAGLSDLASEFGTENGSSYDEWYFGTPYEKPEGFIKSSPITYISKAKTPTLILQGENDVTDPIGQSQQLYRALKRYNVPAELVLYPREGHGLSEEKHLVDRLNRVVEWYQRWVK